MSNSPHSLPLTESAQDLLTRIFPEGTSVHQNPPTPNSEDDLSQWYWVISGKSGDIRWLVPNEARLGQIALAEWHPFGFLSGIKWHVFNLLYASGLLRYLPGMAQIQIKLPPQSDWSTLGWKDEDSTPVSVIYVGTPCATQKLIVFLVHPHRKQVVSVAKIPLAEGAKKNILHEADILETLAEQYPTPIAPSVICRDNTLGRTTQTHLAGALMNRTFTRLHRDFLIALIQPASRTSLKEKSIELEHRLQAIRLSLPNLPDLDPAFSLAHQALSSLKTDTTPFPQCYVHGDFAPWNLKCSQSGQLIAVDWESASDSGLPLQDIFHFFWIQDYLFEKKGTTFKMALQNPAVQNYLQHLDIDTTLSKKLYGYSLLEYWCRRLEEGSQSDAQQVYNHFASNLTQHMGGLK